MTEPEISTVSAPLALVAAIFSILPLFFLLNHFSISEYLIPPRLSSFVRRWESRKLPLLPQPALALGLLAGFLSILIIELFGSFLIENSSGLNSHNSQLSWVIMISFVYAAFFEETIKCALGLLIVYWFATVRHRPRQEQLKREKSQRIFLYSTPFITGGVGLGFALLENMRYIEGVPTTAIFQAMFVRGVISSSVHTAINFDFGLRLLRARKGTITETVIFGYIICILWHGCFDFFALSNEPLPSFIAIIIVILLVSSTLLRTRQELITQAASFLKRYSHHPHHEEVAPGAVITFLKKARHSNWPDARSTTTDADSSLDLENPLFYNSSWSSIDQLFHPLPNLNHSRQFSDYQLEMGRLIQEAFSSSNYHIKAFHFEPPSAGYYLPEILKKSQLNLAELHPFQLYDIQIVGDHPSRNHHIYLSSGLAPWLGRELWIAFSTPFPDCQLLFLLLQMQDDEQLDEFQVRPLYHNWPDHPLRLYPALITLPLINPNFEELKKTFRGRANLPLELILINRSEYRFIKRFGMSQYLDLVNNSKNRLTNDLSQIRQISG